MKLYALVVFEELISDDIKVFRDYSDCTSHFEEYTGVSYEDHLAGVELDTKTCKTTIIPFDIDIDYTIKELYVLLKVEDLVDVDIDVFTDMKLAKESFERFTGVNHDSFYNGDSDIREYYDQSGIFTTWIE